MREVLDRFGRIALPAFVVVVTAGAANALIELGSVSQLWQTAYGRVLIVKIALVSAIVAASYTHALLTPPPRRGGRPWFRLRIALGSSRVLAMRMITVGHFMDQRYYALNAQVRIQPPAARR
jgi:putative copper export protein